MRIWWLAGQIIAQDTNIRLTRTQHCAIPLVPFPVRCFKQLPSICCSSRLVSHLRKKAGTEKLELESLSVAPTESTM